MLWKGTGPNDDMADLLPRDLYVNRLNDRFEAAITKWAEKQ